MIISIQKTSNHNYQFSGVLVFTDLSYRWPQPDGGLPKMTAIWKWAGNTINNKWRNHFVSRALSATLILSISFWQTFHKQPSLPLTKKIALQDIVCIHFKLSCSDFFGLHSTLWLISAKFPAICFSNGTFNFCSAWPFNWFSQRIHRLTQVCTGKLYVVFFRESFF